VKRLAIAIVLAVPGAAHAFSDPALFGQPVAMGGGAGRYFTGSRVDGHACSVCHEGGGTAVFTVAGIPDAPVAGQRYELRVSWADPDTPHALQMELTGADGKHPSVSITPAAMLPAESRCGNVASGEPAVYLTDVSGRRIVGVEDCGAAAVTVAFVATGSPIELAIGGIVSDASGTVEGDAIFEQRTMIGAKLVATGGGGCAAGGDGIGLATGLLVLLTAARARRAR
jgi:hypothetical protein